MRQTINALLALTFILGAQVTWASAEKCQILFKDKILYPQMSEPTKAPHFTRGYGVHEFAEQTAARIFVELATRDMLLSQNAASLDAKGLLQPNGGLCVSSCMTNLLGSMTAHYENFLSYPKNAPQILEQLVLAHNQHFVNIDARYGTFVDKLSDIMSFIFPQILQGFGFNSSFENLNITRSKPNWRNLSYSLSQAFKEDSIAIITAQAIDPMLKDLPPHAVILLKIDTIRKKLYISDPNNPNMITVIPYEYKYETGITFNLPFTFKEFPVRIVDADVFTRTIHKTQ